MGLKDIEADNNLIRYLYRNKHTSPFEQVEFKFVIKCPLFVKNQLVRHRTANLNEFSQRYSEVKDEDGSSFYHPSTQLNGIRGQDKINKQASTSLNPDDQVSLRLKVEEIERTLEKTVDMYKELLEKGMSRETARFCLSNSTWTTLYFKMDLHNLLGFLALRLSKHTQEETRAYANAIYTLIKPLVPVTMEIFENTRINSITFSATEIETIKNKKEFKGTKTEEAEFKEKMEKLGL
jgi:thymidylate synthase (FAD)